VTQIAMDSIGKLLLGLGSALLAAGIAILVLSRYGVHKLPGDIIIRRGRITFYLPLGLMIVLSLALTVVLNLFSRRLRGPWRGRPVPEASPGLPDSAPWACRGAVRSSRPGPGGRAAGRFGEPGPAGAGRKAGYRLGTGRALRKPVPGGASCRAGC